MLANSSPMSVGDFCNDLKTNKIRINDDYQRNAGLWSPQAKAYFIESILLEFPIPKMFVYAKIDLKTKGTIKEIVDGQQRSGALRDFSIISFVYLKSLILKNSEVNAIPI